MDGLRPACGFDNVVDEARESVGCADMPDLASAKAIQLRVEQFRDEIVRRTSMEKIDGNEPCRSIRQKIPGEMT
jgi:hypothetical protein